MSRQKGDGELQTVTKHTVMTKIKNTDNRLTAKEASDALGMTVTSFNRYKNIGLIKPVSENPMTFKEADVLALTDTMDEFDTRSRWREDKWEQNLSLLEEFRSEHGHLNPSEGDAIYGLATNLFYFYISGYGEQVRLKDGSYADRSAEDKAIFDERARLLSEMGLMSRRSFTWDERFAEAQKIVSDLGRLPKRDDRIEMESGFLLWSWITDNYYNKILRGKLDEDQANRFLNSDPPLISKRMVDRVRNGRPTWEDRLEKAEQDAADGKLERRDVYWLSRQRRALRDEKFTADRAKRFRESPLVDGNVISE